MDITHCSQVQWKKTVLELNYMCLNNQMTAKECVILKPKVHAKPMCIDKAVALLSNYYSIVLDFFFLEATCTKKKNYFHSLLPWLYQLMFRGIINAAMK